MATATLVGGLTIVALAGCSAIEKSTADVYSVDYDVTLTGTVEAVAAGSIKTIPHVEVQQSVSRGDESTLTALADEKTKPGEHAGSTTWSKNVLVAPGDLAKVVVAGIPGVAATCTVLIDGEKQIATESAGPGEPVTCQAKTGPFPK